MIQSVYPFQLSLSSCRFPAVAFLLPPSSCRLLAVAFQLSLSSCCFQQSLPAVAFQLSLPSCQLKFLVNQGSESELDDGESWTQITDKIQHPGFILLYFIDICKRITFTIFLDTFLFLTIYWALKGKPTFLYFTRHKNYLHNETNYWWYDSAIRYRIHRINT